MLAAGWSIYSTHHTHVKVMPHTHTLVTTSCWLRCWLVSFHKHHSYVNYLIAPISIGVIHECLQCSTEKYCYFPCLLSMII